MPGATNLTNKYDKTEFSEMYIRNPPHPNPHPNQDSKYLHVKYEKGVCAMEWKWDQDVYYTALQ